MKVLLYREDCPGVKAIAFCCSELSKMHGLSAFGVNSLYTKGDKLVAWKSELNFTMRWEARNTWEVDMHYCPFCGEKIEIGFIEDQEEEV